jgi:hypothetical protein
MKFLLKMWLYCWGCLLITLLVVSSDNVAHHSLEYPVPQVNRNGCRENKRNYHDSAAAINFQNEISSYIPDFIITNWNSTDSWRNLFNESSRLTTIHPNNLFFLPKAGISRLPSSGGGAHSPVYFLWDIFLREDKIVVIASRYLPIALQELYFTIDALKEGNDASSSSSSSSEKLVHIDNVHVICCFESFRTNNANEVIIGYFANERLIEYLKGVSVNEKIQIKLHLYSHSFEYEVHKLFSSVPAPLPSSSQSSASASSASVNFSSSPSSSPSAAPSVPRRSLSSSSSYAVSPPLYAVTLIGADILVQEVITWLSYHEAIGIHSFFIYFCVSITSDFATTLSSYASECVSCHITVLSWYPFHVSVPHNRLRGKPGSSQLAVIQSALFRLRSIEYPIWMTHIDIDEYLVVHPRFSSLPDMIHGYGKYINENVAAIFFHNSYFYMPPSLNPHDSKKSIPTGYTWKEFLSHPIIFERELKHYAFRPKLLANIQKIISIGGHRIDLSEGPSIVAESRTFYLHFLRLSRGRDPSLIKSPVWTNLTTFLTLPRSFNVQVDGFNKWDNSLWTEPAPVF